MPFKIGVRPHLWTIHWRFNSVFIGNRATRPTCLPFHKNETLCHIDYYTLTHLWRKNSFWHQISIYKTANLSLAWELLDISCTNKGRTEIFCRDSKVYKNFVLLTGLSDDLLRYLQSLKPEYILFISNTLKWFNFHLMKLCPRNQHI